MTTQETLPLRVCEVNREEMLSADDQTLSLKTDEVTSLHINKDTIPGRSDLIMRKHTKYLRNAFKGPQHRQQMCHYSRGPLGTCSAFATPLSSQTERKSDLLTQLEVKQGLLHL